MQTILEQIGKQTDYIEVNRVFVLTPKNLTEKLVETFRDKFKSYSYIKVSLNSARSGENETQMEATLETDAEMRLIETFVKEFIEENVSN